MALNERVQGLEAGLPTEAQWEHACRAGTTAATYAGDLDILGENNAPGLDEIAWYGGNSGVGYELEKGGGSSGWPNKQYPHTKARTREVASKRPNPWGLYDMLGNVWEWCTDMRRDYRSSRVVDPVGPPGPGRVIRGGSWRSDARLVRAAFRLWLEPGDRGDDLGFRISQGQGLRQPDQPDQPAASDEQEREAREGTDRRPPGGRRR